MKHIWRKEDDKALLAAIDTLTPQKIISVTKKEIWRMVASKLEFDVTPDACRFRYSRIREMANDWYWRNRKPSIPSGGFSIVSEKSADDIFKDLPERDEAGSPVPAYLPDSVLETLKSSGDESARMATKENPCITNWKDLNGKTIARVVEDEEHYCVCLFFLGGKRAIINSRFSYPDTAVLELVDDPERLRYMCSKKETIGK